MCTRLECSRVYCNLSITLIKTTATTVRRSWRWSNSVHTLVFRLIPCDLQWWHRWTKHQSAIFYCRERRTSQSHYGCRFAYWDQPVKKLYELSEMLLLGLCQGKKIKNSILETKVCLADTRPESDAVIQVQIVKIFILMPEILYIWVKFQIDIESNPAIVIYVPLKCLKFVKTVGGGRTTANLLESWYLGNGKS